jgi:prevent-host-death family protein
MKIAPIAEIKARLSEYIRQSSKEPVIITKNGRPTAILAGITDEDDLESLVLAYNPKFRRLLLEAEKRVKEGQGIKHESFWKAVERKG